MGYRKVPTIYTLNEIPGEDGLVVRMKAIKIGKIRRLIHVVDSAAEDELAGSLDEIFNLLADGLISWNLEGDDGPVPADLSGIEEQELPLILKILNNWLEFMTGVDEELGKDSRSGAKFPGQPLTMEAV